MISNPISHGLVHEQEKNSLQRAGVIIDTVDCIGKQIFICVYFPLYDRFTEPSQILRTYQVQPPKFLSVMALPICHVVHAHKVIMYKSLCEVFLLDQPKIECVFFSKKFFPLKHKKSALKSNILQLNLGWFQLCQLAKNQPKYQILLQKKMLTA